MADALPVGVVGAARWTAPVAPRCAARQPPGRRLAGTIDDDAYDLTSIHWLTVDSRAGPVLAGILGWDPRPSTEQVIAWLLYIVPVTTLFLREDRQPAPARSDLATASAH